MVDVVGMRRATAGSALLGARLLAFAHALASGEAPLPLLVERITQDHTEPYGDA